MRLFIRTEVVLILYPNESGMNVLLWLRFRSESIKNNRDSVVILQVLDCGDGYACLKSRWLDQDPSISGEQNSLGETIPRVLT